MSKEGTKLVSKELSEEYERLLKREMLHKEAIKSGVFIRKLGVAIFLISFFIIFVDIISPLSDLRNLLLGCWGLSLLLYTIGYKIINRKKLLAPFPAEKKEFLNAVYSLKDIETFQKEDIEYSRIKAAERLSKFENQLIEPEHIDELWENLTTESIENMRLLKQNFKDRLIPSIIQGKEEDINKASIIIEKFAKYLLYPTVSEVKDLNKSMLELNFYPPEKSRIAPFFGHPYVRHVFFLAMFVFCGVFAYYLSKYLGSSTDSAISNGFYVSIGLIAGYMIFMLKKS